MFNNWYGAGKVKGKWLEMLGLKPEGGARVYPDDKHFGVDSKGVNYHQTNLIPLIGTSGEQFAPDILVLNVITNNAASTVGETYVAGNGAGSTRDAYRTLVSSVYTKLPGVKLIVATGCPLQNSTFNANIQTLNATIFADSDAAAAASGNKTIAGYWDLNKALGGPTWDSSYFASDQTHPNDAKGYPALAATLYPLLVSLI